jgi:hypothetical protein
LENLPVLKLDPNPTFPWPVTFKSPDGEQTVVFMFRHMTVDEHDAWWSAAHQCSIDFKDACDRYLKDLEESIKAGKEAPEMPKRARSGFDEIMDVVAGWLEVEGEFSREAMAKLVGNYHDLTARKICEAWSAGLTQRKLEN